jgi:hypothetical protein
MPEFDAFDQDQWSRPCTAVIEEGPGRLRLRVALARSEAICDVFVAELGDRVEVEVLVCATSAAGWAGSASPTRSSTIDLYLQTALNHRAVIDLSSGETVVRERTGERGGRGSQSERAIAPEP